MSIIPYGNDRNVVLRHNDSVVFYDAESKAIAVSSANEAVLNECPYCHRSLRTDTNPPQHSNQHGSASRQRSTPGFVSPGYFGILQDSHAQPAQSPTPLLRRIVDNTTDHKTNFTSHVSASMHNESEGERFPRSSPAGISASAFSQGYFQRFFLVMKELGRGGAGVVMLVTHVLDNVELGTYACKRVPVGNDHAWLSSVLNEVRLLVLLSHQNLVYYKHVWLEDVRISTFGPSVPCVFILQQFCNGGDLHKHILGPAPKLDHKAEIIKERARRRSTHQHEPVQAQQIRRLRFEEIYSLFKDITMGLNHLHVNGYVHRDLKPSNCLLHDDGQDLRVLVSDFGEVQTQNDQRKSTGATGTISYCAPELLKRDPDTGKLGNFTTKSDIFSLGMILYFLCFARLPYANVDLYYEENEDLDLLKQEIVEWSGLGEERKLRPDLPEQLYMFLKKLLSLDPAARPEAVTILNGIKAGTGLDSVPLGGGMSSAASPAASPGDSNVVEEIELDMPRITRVASPSASSIAVRRATITSDSSELRQRLHRPSLTSTSSALSISHNSSSPLTPQAIPQPQRLLEYPQRSASIRWPSFRTFQVALFLAKSIVLHAACSPNAVRWQWFYGLHAMSALEILFTSSWQISGIFAIMHIFVLWYSESGAWAGRGLMCS